MLIWHLISSSYKIIQVSARNAAIERITQTIDSKAYRKWKNPSPSHAEKLHTESRSRSLRDGDGGVDGDTGLVRFDEMFHQSFFFGDLNYRLEMPRLEV
ncbi:hypothetical protein EON63_04635 [archaeon]|nr:MAG: hypothetical protein EON63_04635 [archaeon]